MTAVLRVDLGKAEHLTIGQRASEVLLHFLQVVHLFLAQGQTFLLVVSLQVGNVYDRLWLDVGLEYFLSKSLVHALEHRVMVGILVGYGEIFLDAGYTFQSHILGYFYSIRTPRGNHLLAWANKITFQVFFAFGCCIAEQPTKLLDLLCVGNVIHLNGNHAVRGGSEK